MLPVNSLLKVNSSLGPHSVMLMLGQGLSESLAREVTDFNIRVLLVEAGAFRTRFLQSKAVPKKELTSAYIDSTVGNTLKYFDALDGTQ